MRAIGHKIGGTFEPGSAILHSQRLGQSLQVRGIVVCVMEFIIKRIKFNY